MTTAALKAKLKEEIDKEANVNVLKSIEFLLAKDTKAERVRMRMLEMAIRSEQDIAQGKVIPWEDAKAKLQNKIDQYRKDRAVQQRMLEVAAASERDFKAGRTMSIDELFEQMDDEIAKSFRQDPGKMKG